jgi:septal ring factor EnvC (AmiA/AmiB activator)
MIPGELEQLLQVPSSVRWRESGRVYQSPPAQRAAGAACLWLMLAVAGTALAQGDALPEQELETLRGRLVMLRDRLREDVRERDTRLAALRETELALTGVSGELAALARQMDEVRARRAELDGALAARRAALAEERARLAAQLRAMYRDGPSAPLQLLLRQEEPGAVTRLLTWQGYLSRHRAAIVEGLAGEVASLGVLREARERETEKLAALVAARETRLAALARTRRSREALVAALEADIRETGEEIARIEAREAQLEALLADLAALFSDAPSADLERPFADRRGSLDWPVDGRLAADYGDPRVGPALRWKGLVIAAERGAVVRAVAHGRVAYADWLPGLGLLVVLEHGDGYLSLYGHNDTLLRGVGDWVAPGEAIATVGDSGGRPSPGLYFEIRSGRRHLNPQTWFSAPLGR